MAKFRSILPHLYLWGRWGKEAFLRGHGMQCRAGGRVTQVPAHGRAAVWLENSPCPVTLYL